MTKKLKRILLTLSIFFLPNRLSFYLIRIFHPSLTSFRCGFSILWAQNLNFSGDVKIGSGNIFIVNSLLLCNANVGHFNRLKGLFDVFLKGDIGNFNTIINSNTTSLSKISLDVFSKITSRHRIDLSGNFFLGKNSIIAGMGSQIWSHSYGKINGERFRIDGDVKICDDCYIGSACIIVGPLFLGPDNSVGAGVVLSGEHDYSGCAIVTQKNRTFERALRNDVMLGDDGVFSAKDEKSEPTIHRRL